ncbi:MAG: hypothetical protein U0164_15320 [Gemmatimonadaceae bacterium]
MTPRRLQPTRHAAHTLLTAPDFNIVAMRHAGSGRSMADEGRDTAPGGAAPLDGRTDNGAVAASDVSRNPSA